MVNIKYEHLSKMTNNDLLRELVHRMENWNQHSILLGKWNSFHDCDGQEYAIKIEKRESV